MKKISFETLAGHCYKDTLSSFICFIRFAVYNFSVVMLLGAVVACSGANISPPSNADEEKNDSGKIFGDLSFSIGGESSANKTNAKAEKIGINGDLWSATLNVLSRLPITAIDSLSGTLSSDWYSPPNASNLRYKVNAFVLDTALRSDAISVRVNREEKVNGNWVAMANNSYLENFLEESILRNARARYISRSLN